RIIGVLLLVALLAACNAIKVSYSQGTKLVYWWIDGYVDVNDRQKAHVRDAIAAWFRWHRAHELPIYAQLLQRAQAQALEPTTPEALCGWVAEGRRLGRAAL